MNKLLKILIISLLISFIPLKSFSQAIISEILGIRAEENCLLVDVAKKYPEVKFLQGKNEIRIELFDTAFHKNFTNDENVRGNVLLGLNYLTNFTVRKVDVGISSVQITLNIKPGIEVSPKIASTKNNILKIAILKPEKPKENPDVLGKDLQSVFNSAVEEQTAGNLDKSIELYNQVIAKNKDFYMARYNLAKVYADKSMFNESIRLLVDLVNDMQKKPYSLDKQTYFTVINTLGTVYYQTGYYNNARKQFLYIIKMDPGYYQAYYNIGLVNEKLKEIKLAIESFKKAVELKPDFVDAYYHVGILSLILNEKEDASSAFKKVIELAPESKLAELSLVEVKKLDKKFH